MAINLTTKKVEQLRKQGRGRYLDEQVRGLMLCVNSPTSAAWALRYEKDGRERWLGLGGLKDLPLAQARERAREKRLQLLDGKDPLDQKRAERAARRAADLRAMTFKQCAEAYLAAHSHKWRNARFAAQWPSSLAQYVYPIIGGLPVAEIDTALVLKVLEQEVEATDRYPAGKLWVARRETANRVRARVEAVIGWAIVRGHRTGDNPARWRGHLATVLPTPQVAQEHHAALPFRDVPELVAALRKQEGLAARTLEFLVLTAARSSEAAGARWDEIDLNEAVWTIPASRMKAGREHRVPLTPRAVELLRSLYTQEGNPFVFINGSGGGLDDRALWRFMRQMGQGGTVHGLRSAFRDWAGEQTAFPHDVAEAALAHVRGDKSVRAYARGDLFDKRRRLMEAWASYIASPAKATADVVPLKKAN
ncbi:MAG TPA: tyrosine-type recombinase/integrase [Stellaceae bacterium]|jgi:integrase|nr:tyrosine-type recombinase/integrase [Stellaceae bacterium]